MCGQRSTPQLPSRSLPPPPKRQVPVSCWSLASSDTGLRAALSFLVQRAQRHLSAARRVCAVLGHSSFHRANPPDGVQPTDCSLPTTPGLGPGLLLTQQPPPSSLGCVWGAPLSRSLSWAPECLEMVSRCPPTPHLSLSLSPESRNHNRGSSCHILTTPLLMTAPRPAPLPHCPLHRQAHVRPQMPESLLTTGDLAAVGSWGATGEGGWQPRHLRGDTCGHK